VREQLETVGLESDGVIKSTMGGKKRNRYVSHYPSAKQFIMRSCGL
jgi:hypothetical protein